MGSAQQRVIMILIAMMKLFSVYVEMIWMVAFAIIARVIMTVILLVKYVLVATA